MYRRGARMEYKAIEDLRSEGFDAQRVAGSHGPFDIIAWNASTVRLIQVKYTSDPSRIVAQRRKALAGWRGHFIPEVEGVTVEIWIRCRGEWAIFRPFAREEADR